MTQRNPEVRCGNCVYGVAMDGVKDCSGHDMNGLVSCMAHPMAVIKGVEGYCGQHPNFFLPETEPSTVMASAKVVK